MLYLLAEAAPADNAAWNSNLSYLLSMVAIIVTIYGSLSNRRQRRAVTFETEFARKTDMDRLESCLHEFKEALDQIRRDIIEMQREVQRSGEARSAQVHERMNGISEELTRAVGEIRGELKGLSRKQS